MYKRQYDESIGEQILNDLGLGDLINNGRATSVADFLRRTQEIIEDLPASEASLVSATAAVLSDVLVVSPNASVSEISDAAVAITEEVITSYPDYPTAPGGGDIYLDLTVEPDFIKGVVENPDDPVVIPDSAEKEAEPVPDPDEGTPPPTGGTGGTGGTLSLIHI